MRQVAAFDGAVVGDAGDGDGGRRCVVVDDGTGAADPVDGEGEGFAGLDGGVIDGRYGDAETGDACRHRDGAARDGHAVAEVGIDQHAGVVGAAARGSAPAHAEGEGDGRGGRAREGHRVRQVAAFGGAVVADAGDGGRGIIHRRHGNAHRRTIGDQPAVISSAVAKAGRTIPVRRRHEVQRRPSHRVASADYCSQSRIGVKHAVGRQAADGVAGDRTVNVDGRQRDADRGRIFGAADRDVVRDWFDY